MVLDLDIKLLVANNRRQHGLHNKKACDILVNSGDNSMNDWIVTTSFYASLHFVHHHIFPLPSLKRLYQDFDAYYNSEHPYQDLTKHTVTKNLVADHLPEISNKYNWLFKECFNARYRNYSVHPSVATKAIEYMNSIEDGTDE